MRSGMNDRPLLAAAAATGRRLLVVICTLALVQAATRWTGSRPAAAFAVPGMALAQAAGESTRKTPALRNDVYEKLAEAQKLAEAGKPRQALAELDALRDSQGRRRLNSYELANLHNFYAFVYFQQEQYARAVQSYRQVLAQPDLPQAMAESTHYALAQLYFAQEDYGQAVRSLQEWFRLAQNPQPDAYILLAQAYYQNKQYDAALRNVEQGMRLAAQAGKPAKENWYLLMRALYYDKGDLKKVVWVLEELLRRWPKKEYLVQLSGMYGELGNERGQVAAMECAYVMGWLQQEQELLNMAYLFIATDTPYKAAGVLEQGLARKAIQPTAQNYELLGSALRTAQERQRAIPALRRAAELDDDGEPWVLLANIYLDLDDYGKAVEAAEAALRRGGLKWPEDVRLVLGMALFHQGQLDAARRQFELAVKSPRSAKSAADWLRYLDAEIERRRSLRDALG